MEIIEQVAKAIVKNKPGQGRKKGIKNKQHKEQVPNCSCKGCGRAFYVPPSIKHNNTLNYDRQFHSRGCYNNWRVSQAFHRIKQSHAVGAI